MDKLIVVNMINYFYFNLDGDLLKDNFDYLLILNVDYYIFVDSIFMMIGEIVLVEGIFMDFRFFVVIGICIN